MLVELLVVSCSEYVIYVHDVGHAQTIQYANQGAFEALLLQHFTTTKYNVGASIMAWLQLPFFASPVSRSRCLNEPWSKSKAQL